MGFMSPPVVLAYRGYGNKNAVVLHGPVLDDRILFESKKTDRSRKNFKAMLSRYVSNVLPEVRVKIRFKGIESIVETDQNGYFKTVFDLSEIEVDSGWQKASFEVIDKIVENQTPIISEAVAYIQKEDSCFGIISDVDDTILVSYANQMLRKLRLILTKNAYTRLPFKGVAAFYQALVSTTEKKSKNPIFYVSSSEWNLYDFLIDFCKVRHIPKGVFLLQNYKKNLKQLILTGGGNHEHKLFKIREILIFYPNINFILIGDSGQRDPVLYSQIVNEFPGRIKSIYIRDVKRKNSESKIKDLVDQLQNNEVEMLLTETTLEAAIHAASKGYIDKSKVENIRNEVKMDSN